MKFTHEELILMMIYSPGTRRGLITTLEGMRQELTGSERKLRSLTDSVLDKLAQISDEEFDRLPLYPDIDL